MAYRWSAIALLVSGCGSNSSPPPPPPPSKDAAVVEDKRAITLDRQATPVPEVVLPMQQAFEVKSAGKGASAALHYALAPGPMSYLSATKLTARRLSSGKWGPPVAVPAVTNGVALAFADAASPLAGRALPGEVAKGGDPAAAETYLADWRALEGRRFTAMLDARGQLGAIKLADDPAGTRTPGAVEDLQHRLLLTLVPVPDVPVGVGAQWRVVTVLRQRPFVVKQTASYTLLARSEKSWKIGVELQRVGEPQTVSDPTVPKDQQVELVALVRKYKGTLDVSPSTPIGIGKLDVSSTMHLRITQRMKGSTEEILEDTGTVTLTRATAAQ